MNKKLRCIPSVDKLLNDSKVKKYSGIFGEETVKFCIREVLKEVREDVKRQTLNGEKLMKHQRQSRGRESRVRSKRLEVRSKKLDFEIVEIVNKVAERVNLIADPSLKPIVNATGIILHTNLGRAPLGKYILDALEPVVLNYSNLEFDLETAKRGERNDHIQRLLTFVTQAEDIIVVNNNAAGVLLTLNTFADKKEVIVSRGELIEIGGSFRIPEIMKASGAKMVEVGTTNRTRLSDYQKAITDKTRIIFKAHKSNYYIKGFSEEVEIDELSALAKKHKLTFVYDIGSGLLRKPKGLPLKDEPDVRTSLKKGVDLITFSCDKLLGGPQAGVVAGKKELIEQLAKNPMMRALRIDKLTIAALSAALRSYLKDEELITQNPTFHLLSRSRTDLEKLAEKLFTEFAVKGIESQIIETKAQCGGGTLPQLEIDSYAVQLSSQGKERKFAERIYKLLLKANKPVLGILREGRLLFDVLSIFEDDIPYIAKAVKDVL
ncbi:MAG: L-seryl-tRNA(Sec) selenium transferase [Ignavibacteria bacterium RBG_13_36_8]|nr:MAG: L-seryl-tRNA(Sec) selenium transferase [Ignavibacteria bacterium RBG_13_36_8]